MQRLNVGIIGCGVIAPTHAESYQKIKNVDLVWTCDLIEDKALAVGLKYGAKHVTTDYREVLGDASLDAVSVCTDHASHSKIVVDALKAGKHVLCEKALASSEKGLNAMFEAHRRRPKLVFAGVFQHRYDPVPRYTKSLVDSGAFGKILTAAMQVRCKRTDAYYDADQWRGTWAKEGGSVLINQSIHYIDVLAWLMGGVDSLAGVYENLTHQKSIETEDTATAALRFKCGAVGTIEATCSSHLDWETTISIHGSEGSLDLRDDKPFKIVFADKKKEEKVRQGFEIAASEPGVLLGKSYYGSGHPAQLQDFVDAIRRKRSPFVPAISARHTVDVVLSIYKSHRKGAWVKVP